MSTKPKPRIFDPPLALQRYRKAAKVLADNHVERFADVGCGDGNGLAEVMGLRNPVRWKGRSVPCRFTFGVGLDKVKEGVNAKHIVEKGHSGNPYLPLHVSLWEGDLVDNDVAAFGKYLKENNVDSCISIEVIEHVDDVPKFTDVLFSQTVFDFRLVVVTTPNRDANRLMGMEPGTMRHDDHKFEWTGKEFRTWARRTCKNYGWEVEITGVGEIKGTFASSVAVFKKKEWNGVVQLSNFLDECTMPACGGCSYKRDAKRRCTENARSKPNEAQEYSFSTIAHAWLAYDVAIVVYDAIQKQEGWVPLSRLQKHPPLLALLECLPDYNPSTAVPCIDSLLTDAYDIVGGIESHPTVPYLVHAMSCKWCGNRSACEWCVNADKDK